MPILARLNLLRDQQEELICKGKGLTGILNFILQKLFCIYAMNFQHAYRKIHKHKDKWCQFLINGYMNTIALTDKYYYLVC